MDISATIASRLAHLIIAGFQDMEDVSKDDLIELHADVADAVFDMESDFTVEVSSTGHTYRIIQDSEESLVAIWKEELKEQVEESYPELFGQRVGLQAYMTFDWDAFYRDAEHDGYGHHFSTYDGSEEHASIKDDAGKTIAHYIFRIN